MPSRPLRSILPATRSGQVFRFARVQSRIDMAIPDDVDKVGRRSSGQVSEAVARVMLPQWKWLLPMTAARPRNQLYRHNEVATFWRPRCFLGGSQHRGQIASQLDPELALVRYQDDRIDKPSEHL